MDDVATKSEVKLQENVSQCKVNSKDDRTEKEDSKTCDPPNVKHLDHQDQNESIQGCCDKSNLSNVKHSGDPEQKSSEKQTDNVSDSDNFQCLNKQVQKITEELIACQKKLAKRERQLEKATDYNEELRKELDKLSTEVHHYRSLSRRLVDVGTQVESDLLQVKIEAEHGHGITQSVNEEPVEPEPGSQTSIAEELKSAADEAMQQTGFVYDEQTGLYYDYNSGYYYDSDKALYYDPRSGTYFYFNPETQEYEFHSQVDLSQYSASYQQPHEPRTQEMAWTSTYSHGRDDTPHGSCRDRQSAGRKEVGHTKKSGGERKNRGHRKSHEKDVKRLGTSDKVQREKRRRKDRQKEEGKSKKKRKKGRQSEEKSDVRKRTNEKKERSKEKHKRKREKRRKKREKKDTVEDMDLGVDSKDAVHVVDSGELYDKAESVVAMVTAESTNSNDNLYQDISVGEVETDNKKNDHDILQLDRNDNSNVTCKDHALCHADQVYTDNAVSDSMFCQKTIKESVTASTVNKDSVNNSLGFDGVKFEVTDSACVDSSSSDVAIGTVIATGDTVNSDVAIGNSLATGNTVNSDVAIGTVIATGDTVNSDVTIGNSLATGNTVNSDVAIGNSIATLDTIQVGSPTNNSEDDTNSSATYSSDDGSSSESDSDSICTGESEMESDRESELESGELSESSDSSESSVVVISDFEEECPEVIDVESHQSELEAAEETASHSWPPCIRVIVTDSDCLDCGSLFIVTCSGATIGREKEMGHTIIIPDLNVSKLHAEITFDETQRKYMIKDVGSQNGTYLNERRISEVKTCSNSEVLSHCDILQLGCTRLLLHIHPGTETCDGCEPGQVQAALMSSQQKNEIQVLSKDEKIKLQRQQLNQIKKRYGLKNIAYVDNTAAIKNPAYSDKAEIRRKTKGSDNPYQPDEAPASVARPIAENNVGHKLLKKMGWSEGESLGKDNEGIQAPIGVTIRANQKAGLGSELACHQSLDNAHDLRKTQRWIKNQKRFQAASVNIETPEKPWVKGPTQNN